MSDTEGELLIRQDGSKLKIGDRVESEGFFATVKFIGEVPTTNVIWLGVEWDDPTRGKHDGTFKGKHYFDTREPNAGSFIRPKKATLGVPYIRAVTDRYGKISDENAGIDTKELYVQGAANQRTFLEVVGAKSVNEKQSQLDRLQEAVLRGMFVYGPGLMTDTHHHTPNLRILDLSKNLLSSWEDVAVLCSRLQQLESLNVSENKLTLPSDPLSLGSSFPELKTLYLNRMGYDWSEILRCTLMFPHLCDLHVCFNRIKHLSDPEKQLPPLRLLNLEANQIESWGEILNVGSLSELETLIVNGNQIDCIYFPDVNEFQKTEFFPKLKSLSVARNKIAKWVSVNELNKLKCLTQLNAKENVVTQSDVEDNIRQMVIAKIAGLKVYNRSQVTEGERKGAEIDYLKKFGKDWLYAGGNRDPEKSCPREEFLAIHPRYMELLERLGAPEDSELKEESKTLKDNLINVSIQSSQDYKVLQKKLPLSMSVQKLKMLIQRLFRASSGNIKLYYISHKMKGPEIELDNDLKEISFYSIENSDTIKVVW